MTEVSEFDHYDSRILGELQRDARITMAELGRRVHLSQPAVTERVRKLEMMVSFLCMVYSSLGSVSGVLCGMGTERKVNPLFILRS